MTLFGFRLKPSPVSTLLFGSLAMIFVCLAYWQLANQAEKQQLENQFLLAPQMNLLTAINQKIRFAQVSAEGRFDTRNLFLDNRIYRGRAGVHVYTPFQTTSGESLLINRGWLPMPPDRRSLPQAVNPGETLTLKGILNVPPTSLQLGEADDLTSEGWPKLITYLDIEKLSERLGMELLPWVVQLDSANLHGFEDRHWKATTMTSSRHGAYAVQWFAFALGSLIYWLVLAWRRGTRVH
jgi:surfeit locus 1 family protein